MNEEFLTTEQAAQFLKMSPKTLAIYRVHGKSPKFIKIGRNVRYLKADLIEWALQKQYTSTSQISA